MNLAAADVEVPESTDHFVQVCDRLAGFHDHASPEWVDGYLTGVLAGPRAVAMAQWLPAMLGDSFQRVFADPSDLRFATRALTARWKEIAGQLDAQALLDDPDILRLAPWVLAYSEQDRNEWVAQGHGTLQQAGDELQSGVAWARGLTAAVAALPEDWVAPPAESEQGLWYREMFECIQALQLPGSTLVPYLQRVLPGETPDRDTLLDRACMAVQALRAYWVDHAPKPQTRHVQAMPGRNDLCHCGSGKKFKKCHGAPH